jgi:outer membrane lipoprotein
MNGGHCACIFHSATLEHRYASMMGSFHMAMKVALFAFAAGMLLHGCAKSAHQSGQDQLDRLVPADVMAQVDKSVSFTDLRSAPNNYVGRTVMFSGLALNARRVKDKTEIEILELPTDRDLTPSDRKSKSEGRFLAVQSNGFLDPAIVSKDTPVTVVGEVKGAINKPLDDGEYQYPVLDIKHLIDWNDLRSSHHDRWNDWDDYGQYGGGYYGLGSPWYYGFGSPFWGPYGFYPYSYYGPYYIFPRGFSVPAPPPPPPSSIPPQFRKSR